MSRYRENRCVGPCPMGCLGAGCPNNGEVEVTVCDHCGNETTYPEDWHYENGDDICPDCWDEEE